MSLTLYSVSDGPPSLAVRQCLRALSLDYKLINVDFGLGEHMTEEYAKVFSYFVTIHCLSIFFVEKSAKRNSCVR